MDFIAETAFFRTLAEDLMTDTLEVTRESDQTVTDPETGVVDYASTVVYDGKGRLQGRDLQGNETDGGGQRFTVFDFSVQVPVHVDLRSGDSVKVVASRTDPLNVGRVFTVSAVPRKTHASSLRATVEEVTP